MLKCTDDLLFLFLLISQHPVITMFKITLFVVITSKIYWGSKTYFAYMLLAKQKQGLITSEYKEKQRSNLKALTNLKAMKT